MMRLILLLIVLWPQFLLAAPWDVVQDETKIEVDVGYLGSTITMRFDEVLGNVDFDAQRPERARASIAVPVAQVETGLGIANNIVKSKDYLNAREHPAIRFRLDRLVRTSENTADIFGSMTMLGVTNPMVFKAKLFRYSRPAEGEPFEAGFNLEGEVDRREFGNTAGLPQVSAILPVRIRLLLREKK